MTRAGRVNSRQAEVAAGSVVSPSGGDPIVSSPTLVSTLVLFQNEEAAAAVKRAETALARLSPHFDAWMANEGDRLQSAHAAQKAAPVNEQCREALLRVAHDIKGQAATFGYPHAGRAAASLCRLLEAHAMESATLSAASHLIEHHVASIQAMVREHAHDIDGALGTELADRLCDATERFIRRTGRNPNTSRPGPGDPP